MKDLRQIKEELTALDQTDLAYEVAGFTTDFDLSDIYEVMTVEDDIPEVLQIERSYLVKAKNNMDAVKTIQEKGKGTVKGGAREFNIELDEDMIIDMGIEDEIPKNFGDFYLFDEGS